MSGPLKTAPVRWHRKLVISAIPKDGTSLEETFAFDAERKISYWDQLYELKGPLKVATEAYRAEGRIVLTISVSAEAEVPCSRCLEPAGVAIEGKLRYLFTPAQKEARDTDADRTADGDEELIPIDSWEDEIDLAPLVWETLITLLPTAPLCSDACCGICPMCGQNLNIAPCCCKEETGDPRFEVLKPFVP